uniref:Uncharacterized protein n=2 Tax=Triticum urartu TaxID=4572 RepID=A0A8R7UAE3_TRIUA
MFLANDRSSVDVNHRSKGLVPSSGAKRIRRYIARRRGRHGAAHGCGVVLVVVVNWRERPPIHARPSTAGLPSSSNILSQFAAAIHPDGPGHTYQHHNLPPAAGDAAIIGIICSPNVQAVEADVPLHRLHRQGCTSCCFCSSTRQ